LELPEREPQALEPQALEPQALEPEQQEPEQQEPERELKVPGLAYRELGQWELREQGLFWPVPKEPRQQRRA
jgi:hypothetical protein